MKTKEDIVQNWLPRYTGAELQQFGNYILLTNFSNFVRLFAKKFDVEIQGTDRPMQCATYNDITIINFGMGSPSAATIMDLLTAISPKAVLFLGKCGGLKKRNQIGDLILPIAAIRGEGTSNDYLKTDSHFWLLPRSSIYKSGLLMANSMGVIDKSYRGELKAPVWSMTGNSRVAYGDRLFQIVAPDMGWIRHVRIVESIPGTSRGTGGFGSTGK